MNGETIAGERRGERFPGIRPVATLSRGLDAAARRVFPGVTAALVLLLLPFPLSLPAAPELRCGFALAAVFFWSVWRPHSMPPLACFVLGMLVDLLGVEPPGLTSFVLLCVHGIALRHRLGLIRRGFLAIWGVFAAVALGATATEWVLTAALDLRLLPVIPAALSATLAIGLYPFLSVLLAEAHGSVAAPERA